MSYLKYFFELPTTILDFLFVSTDFSLFN
jgi:hypothetical protein